MKLTAMISIMILTAKKYALTSGKIYKLEYLTGRVGLIFWKHCRGNLSICSLMFGE